MVKSMKNFTHIINPCRVKAWNRQGNGFTAETFIKIKWEDGKLSITGVVGPYKNGDCAGSCGQILDELLTAIPTAEFTKNDLKRLHAVWKEWYLNDLTAGSPAQETYLKANPVTFEYPQSYYDAACKALIAAGLQPDTSYLRDGKPYSYDSAWLFTEVPADVIAWLESLPISKIHPAWC